MLQQNERRENKLVAVTVLKPFRINEGKKTRETKEGETVEVELWLANALANHHPPKVGPVTALGKTAAARAAA